MNKTTIEKKLFKNILNNKMLIYNNDLITTYDNKIYFIELKNKNLNIKKELTLPSNIISIEALQTELYILTKEILYKFNNKLEKYKEFKNNNPIEMLECNGNLILKYKDYIEYNDNKIKVQGILYKHCNTLYELNNNVIKPIDTLKKDNINEIIDNINKNKLIENIDNIKDIEINDNIMINNKYIYKDNNLNEIIIKNKEEIELKITIKDIMIHNNIFIVQSIDNDIYFCTAKDNTMILIELYSIIGDIVEITDIKQYKDRIFICNNGELKYFNIKEIENNIIKYNTLLKEEEVIMEIEIKEDAMLVIIKNKIIVINNIEDNNLLCINNNKSNMVTGSFIKTENDFIIAVGDEEGILKIYKNNENIITNKIHKKEITNIKIIENKNKEDNIKNKILNNYDIITASMDKRVLILNNGINIIKELIHPRGITTINVNNNKLITGCIDKKIRIYNIHSKEIENIIEGHTASITKIITNNKYIISTDKEGIIRIYNNKNKRNNIIDSKGCIWSIAVINTLEDKKSFIIEDKDNENIEIKDKNIKNIKRKQDNINSINNIIAGGENLIIINLIEKEEINENKIKKLKIEKNYEELINILFNKDKREEEIIEIIKDLYYSQIKSNNIKQLDNKDNIMYNNLILKLYNINNNKFISYLSKWSKRYKNIEVISFIIKILIENNKIKDKEEEILNIIESNNKTIEDNYIRLIGCKLLFRSFYKY